MAKQGEKISEEHKKKISLANKGRRGQIAWNKNKKYTDEEKKKINMTGLLKGIGCNKGLKGLTSKSKGKKFSKEEYPNMGFRKGYPVKRKGADNYNWKGDISTINQLIRRTKEYTAWVKTVMQRDDYTCKKTGVKGGKLVVHHIYNFSSYPELRYEIDNGITLSDKSHREFHKTYGKKNNTVEQLNEFLNNK